MKHIVMLILIAAGSLLLVATQLSADQPPKPEVVYLSTEDLAEWHSEARHS